MFEFLTDRLDKKTGYIKFFKLFLAYLLNFNDEIRKTSYLPVFVSYDTKTT